MLSRGRGMVPVLGLQHGFLIEVRFFLRDEKRLVNALASILHDGPSVSPAGRFSVVGWSWAG